MAADHKAGKSVGKKSPGSQKEGPPVWDWGKLPKDRAERELKDRPDGTFLVRASETAADT